MNRLAQTGIFTIVVGGTALFLGFFPYAVNLNTTPDVGIAQILTILFGLFLVVTGSYVVAYGLIHRGRPGSLMRDIGVRLGMTGLVLSAAAMLADVMGIGSHSAGAVVFGWLQGAGMLTGFLVSMIGVLIYGMARS